MLIDFRDGGSEGEREGEKHQCEKHPSIASHMLPDLDQSHSLGMCPDWESNCDLSVYGTMLQQTEPLDPGQSKCLYAELLWYHCFFHQIVYNIKY